MAASATCQSCTMADWKGWFRLEIWSNTGSRKSKTNVRRCRNISQPHNSAPACSALKYRSAALSQVGNGGLTSDVQAHAALTPLWSVAGLALATTVALGFARFAYGLILPAMRADLHLTYANAGVLNTVNSAGYLATTLAAPWLARRFGHRAVFSVGMFGTALALLACGFTRNFALLSVLRLVAGAAGACAFVLGGALVAAGRYGIGGRASSALSIYVGGGGH